MWKLKWILKDNKHNKNYLIDYIIIGEIKTTMNSKISEEAVLDEQINDHQPSEEGG